MTKRWEMLAGRLELPGELLGDVPRLTLTGNGQALVENHRELLSYTEEAVEVGCGSIELSHIEEDFATGVKRLETVGSDVEGFVDVVKCFGESSLGELNAALTNESLYTLRIEGKCLRVVGNGRACIVHIDALFCQMYVFFSQLIELTLLLLEFRFHRHQSILERINGVALGGDDGEFLADESFCPRFFYIVTGVHGTDELFECFLEIAGIERLSSIVILNVGFSTTQCHFYSMLVVKLLGKSNDIRINEDVGKIQFLCE